jgi:hypothetical protein
MSRGAKPGRTRATAGTPLPRKRGISFPPLPPPDPIRLASSGKIDAEAWQEVRVEVWREWLRLINTPDDREWKRWRAKLWPEGQLDPRCHRPERDPDRPWPPNCAIHDGIEARVLRAYWSPPEGYVNRWDARPTIVELAEQGLEEVAAFREREPGVAETIFEAASTSPRRARP